MSPLRVEVVLSPLQVLDKHLKPCGVYSCEVGIPFAFSRPEEGGGQYRLALVDGCLCYVEQAESAPAVPIGQFWRGESSLLCRHCGHHYDAHTHTDEASLCPPAREGTEPERKKRTAPQMSEVSLSRLRSARRAKRKAHKPR